MNFLRYWAYRRAVLHPYFYEVFKNGTIPDTDVSIKKSQLVWPLIFLVTDNASDDWLMNDLDEAYFEDIKAKYRTLINNVTD